MPQGKKKLSFWEQVKSFYVRDVPKEPQAVEVKSRKLPQAVTFSHVTIGTGLDSVSVMGSPGRLKEILQDHIDARCGAGGSVILGDCSPDMLSWVEHAKRQE